MQLFISYSRDDKNYVYELAQLLKDDAEYDVWLDRRLVGADLWWDTILNEIEQCDAFLMVMTPRSIASIFCKVELQYALAYQKPIIPLMLKNVEVPPALGTIQYINIESVTLYKSLFLCTRAISKVEKRLLQGHYKPLKYTPRRPSLPEPDSKDVEHIYEVFATAEEAVAERNHSLARHLFKKVIEIDPHGLGMAAKERLDEINHDADCLLAYEAVKRLAENPFTLHGARVAWRAFVQRYGTDYDPDDLSAKFNAQDRKVPEHSVEIVRQRLQQTSQVAYRPVSISADRSPGKPPAAVASPSYALAMPVAPIQAILEYFLPDMSLVLPGPFEWCEIPAGDVTLEDATLRLPPGSDGGVYNVEQFHLAKYPITNAQYQVFLDAEDGYCEPTWWDYSTQAQTWRERTPQPKATAFTGDDLPRTCMNWFDAMAFCFWLSALVEKVTSIPVQITLPTEQEWQRAAQGDDGLKYPWGDDFYPEYCNVKSSNEINIATPVDAYPHGASPYGVMDMSGNVREWCLTQWVTDSNSLCGKNPRVLRGGSFYGDEGRARSSYRYCNVPDLRLSSFGFRVALKMTA